MRASCFSDRRVGPRAAPQAGLRGPHTDADGLTAGAIALRARGERAAAAMLLTRVLADDLPGYGSCGPWGRILTVNLSA